MLDLRSSVEDLCNFELCLVKMYKTYIFFSPGGGYIQGAECVLKETSGDYLLSVQVQTEAV